MSDIRPPVSAGPGGVPAHSLTVWPAQSVAFRVMPAARNSSCHSFLTQSGLKSRLPCSFQQLIIFVFAKLSSCLKPYTWCVYLHLLKEHWKDRRVPLTHKWSLVEFLLFPVFFLFFTPPPPPIPCFFSNYYYYHNNNNKKKNREFFFMWGGGGGGTSLIWSGNFRTLQKRETDCSCNIGFCKVVHILRWL